MVPIKVKLQAMQTKPFMFNHNKDKYMYINAKNKFVIKLNYNLLFKICFVVSGTALNIQLFKKEINGPLYLK